jgi:hypothetical protein
MGSRPTSLLCATAAYACAQSIHPIANMFRPQATTADSVYNLSMLMLATVPGSFW